MEAVLGVAGVAPCDVRMLYRIRQCVAVSFNVTEINTEKTGQIFGRLIPP